MVVKGIDEILRRVREENLIENLGPRELNNPEGVGLDLRLGARICNIVFFKIEDKTISYRGRHQGGRVSPEDIERQV